jgi:hypothetical protein
MILRADRLPHNQGRRTESRSISIGLFDSKEASMGTGVVEKQGGWHVVASVLFLAAFLAGPIAVVATMANSPPKEALTAAADVTVSREPALAYPAMTDSGDVGPFAYGYVEFDVDPRRPGGVPGFDTWPPGSSRR